MTIKEIAEFYNDLNINHYKILFKQRKIEEKDVIFKNNNFIGPWDIINDMPFCFNNQKICYICEVTNERCYCVYYTWVNKKPENKFISPSVSRLRNLSNLNKTKIREANIKSYKTPKGEIRKQQYRESRIFFNKNIMPDIMKSFSDEKKINIASKKAKTFHDKPIEIQQKINSRRNPRMYMDEEEKEDLRNRLIKTLQSQSQESSKRAKERWNNYSYDKKCELLEKMKNGWIKKQHETVDIYYQGLLEKGFIDSCLTEGLIPKRGPNIEYFDPIENKIKIYMIDYEVNGYLIEIKSTWWWIQHERINLLKKAAAETYATENNYKAYIIYIVDQKDKKKGFDIDNIKN